MNNYLQIGQFSISFIWLSVVLALFLLSISCRILLHRRLGDWMVNSFLLFVLIWKGSYILFHLPLVLAMPKSALFFDGGTRGLFLSLLGLILYWVRKVDSATLRILPFLSVLYLFQFEFILNTLQANWLAVLYGGLVLTLILLFYNAPSMLALEWMVVFLFFHFIIQSLIGRSEWQVMLFQFLFVSGAGLAEKLGGTHDSK